MDLSQSARIHTKAGRAAARKSPGDVLVLTENDLARMRGLLGPTQAEVDSQKEREFREHLRKKSHDTFVATQKRYEEKKKEASEEAKVAAARQIEKDKDADKARRQAAVQKANLLIFEQDDRVKQFNSKLLMASVLEERANQLALKSELKTKSLRQQETEDSNEALVLREANAAHSAEAEKRKAKSFAVAKGQQSQLASIHEQKLAEKRAERDEGLRIKAEAQAALEAEKAALAARRSKALQAEHETEKMNQRLQDAKAQERDREKEEDKKIEAFAKLKEKQIALRRQKEEEQQQEIRNARSRMIDNQARLLEALQTHEDARIMQQQAEMEDRDDRTMAEKKKQQQKQWQDIDQARKDQLAMRKAKKEEEAAEARRDQGTYRKKMEEAVVEDLECKMSQREKARRLAQYQKKQHDLQKTQNDKSKRQELEDARRQKEAADREDDMFREYIDAQLEDFKSKSNTGRRGFDLSRTDPGRTQASLSLSPQSR